MGVRKDTLLEGKGVVYQHANAPSGRIGATEEEVMRFFMEVGWIYRLRHDGLERGLQ